MADLATLFAYPKEIINGDNAIGIRLGHFICIPEKQIIATNLTTMNGGLATFIPIQAHLYNQRIPWSRNLSCF